MNNNLSVWFEQSVVGQLWQDEIGGLCFSYETDWLRQGFPISQQLPLSQQRYERSDCKAHQFFANLLPEASVRAHLVRDLKIADSDFELLCAVGGECAGALTILPYHKNQEFKESYKKLSDSALEKLLLRRGSIVGLVKSTDRPRISLAGSQDKCPIYFENENYWIPEGCSPSTHILKFEIPGYSNIPAYECFLSELARSVGLPVANSILKRYKKHRFLLVERYDRKRMASKKVKRYHQEDFCQALGVSYVHKYQAQHGPSFYDCYQLIQQVSREPLVDAEHLLRWQIFNYLTGNSDGHAKNLSLCYDNHHRPRLAPFYDLVCTRAMEHIDVKLAMAVGGEYDPRKIKIKHWERFANECNIKVRFLLKLVSDMAQVLLQQIDERIDAYEQAYGSYPALQRVQQVIVKQCNTALKQLR